MMNENQQRSYRQFCGLARSLDMVGERWTLLIIRECLLGPRRFRDLMEHLPGLTTNLLSKRLKQMEANGLLLRIDVGDARGNGYGLSDLGQKLEPVVMALGRFGENLMDAPKSGDCLDAAWATISLKRRYVGGEALQVQLIIDKRPFLLSLDDTYLKIEERHDPSVGFIISGPFPSFQRWWFRGVSVFELRDSGALHVHGSSTQLNRFISVMDRLT